MGNTGVALGRDGAAPFLNPATVVRINDNKIAFSVNFYSIGTTSLKGWHQPGPVDTATFGNLQLSDSALSSTSFNSLPSTLCIFLTLFRNDEGDTGVNSDSKDDTRNAERRAGRQKLAVCLATVERTEFGYTADVFRGTSPGIVTSQNQSLNRTWNRFIIGPTYSFDVNDRFSLGATAGVFVTQYRNIWSTNSLTYDSTNKAVSSVFDKSARGLSFDAGLIVGAGYRMGRNSFGAAIHSPTIHVLGTASSFYQSQYSGVTDVTDRAAATGSFSAPSPPRVSLGWGREESWGSFEANVSYSFPMDGGIKSHLVGSKANVTEGVASESIADLDFRERSLGVVNAAVGAEYFMKPSFSALAGLSTDVSAVPDLAATNAGTSLATFTQSKNTRVALSLGLGTYAPSGDLLIGTELSYGIGQTYAVNPYQLPPNFAVADQRSMSALFVIAGSTSLRTIKKAVDNVVENVGDIVAPNANKK